ncbi:NAD(P)-dependent glycerol-3-phosphate dehydrogenase [Corynebacterium pseudotuberculosis]|uniref:Glycerol-3-phosphate dehydrogenase [NAD(P)+] n=1 Tax=Corynebacterium pseudotuberculosis (strain C231) TaxID=681645 RepID=D9QA16_CORP2|nr:NAD(P)H-dependent glycerol-3-phosphate dehydrogenase [Corynebacterium pseudotuberculosis C231]ADO26185.3 NAD(P)H-dependent glycerol-3-phosphate dehydrogenase [Corynebacterium pseudotuberculosis I19]AEP70161.1 Glycerol-3-phosphate dehydrogenase [NAD(P)+] [Corynebacterium pseudotuberculosis 42/02-A]AFH51852.1 Glycerol-3-phosphate dehydrogenase [NAD(P)+] [Corynebacterium pseudotuberculosis 267]AKC73674.1 Glycerol-3-phosphate dehydrogenase NAD(P)+ [Corynebacterium pseudotuberculosis]
MYIDVSDVKQSVRIAAVALKYPIVQPEEYAVKVAVMGAGSWGTTLAKVFADAGCDVRLWARRSEVAAEINQQQTNNRYLSGIALPTTLYATDDPIHALEDSEIVVLGVPSQTLRENLSHWAAAIPQEAILVSLAKGIEKDTFERMSQVIAEVAGAPESRIAVLSGPNLAREIAEEQPAATVIACTDEANAQKVQAALSAPYFRPYTNTDVIGCEIGGACKNVIALACGMAAGRGLGENTVATVITRGLAEITRLGIAMGADPRTFAGLAGLGDLVATCSSPLSRNRTFGARLGEGKTLEDAKSATNGQVAEGVISSMSISRLAEIHGVDMPITHAVYGVCHMGASVHEMVVALMGRTKKSE